MKEPDIPKLLVMTAGAAVIVVMLLLAFTDSLAFVAFSLLISVIIFVLYYFGFVTFTAKPKELDILYNPDPLALQHVQTASAPAPVANEVFYISDNLFTYEQAPLVCKAYGGELATYSQIEQAYNAGAEWCGYGWSAGGIALYPTQQATWDKLQAESDPQKRIKCGRPGINGGYFDPKTKFGVNCYGIRPTKPANIAAIPSTDPMMDRMLATITKNLSSFVVQPFNKTVWSENPVMDIQAAHTSTPSAAPVPGATQPSSSQTTSALPPAITSTLTSSGPAIPSTSASAAAGSVTQAPPAPATASASGTGTGPMGIITDTFNPLGSSATNFVMG